MKLWQDLKAVGRDIKTVCQDIKDIAFTAFRETVIFFWGIGTGIMERTAELYEKLCERLHGSKDDDIDIPVFVQGSNVIPFDKLKKVV